MQPFRRGLPNRLPPYRDLGWDPAPQTRAAWTGRLWLALRAGSQVPVAWQRSRPPFSLLKGEFTRAGSMSFPRSLLGAREWEHLCPGLCPGCSSGHSLGLASAGDSPTWRGLCLAGLHPREREPGQARGGRAGPGAWHQGLLRWPFVQGSREGLGAPQLLLRTPSLSPLATAHQSSKVVQSPVATSCLPSTRF